MKTTINKKDKSEIEILGVLPMADFEKYEDINEAISQEKRLKKWNRKWKLDLIEESNPNWKDLSKDWISYE